MYPNYLIHFNGNHSSKNGQFVAGDGDKDGIVDDHHNYSRNKGDLMDSKTLMRTAVNSNLVSNAAAKVVCSAARKAAGFAFSKTKLGKTLKEIGAKEAGREFIKVTQLDKIAKDSGLTDAKNRLESKIQGKVAEGFKKGANKAIDQDFQLTNSQAKKLKVGLAIGGSVAVTGATAYAITKGVKSHNKKAAEKRSHFGIPKPEPKKKTKSKPVVNKPEEPYTSEAGKKALQEYYEFFGDGKKKRGILRHGVCGDYIITL